MIRIAALTIAGLLDHAEAEVLRLACGKASLPRMAFSADRQGQVTSYAYPAQTDDAGWHAVAAILETEARRRDAAIILLCRVVGVREGDTVGIDQEIVVLEARAMEVGLQAGGASIRVLAVERGADGLVRELHQIADQTFFATVG